MHIRGLTWMMGLLMLAGVAKEARADFLTYSVTGTFADGGVLSGSFTIYPSLPPNYSLTINDPAAPSRFFVGASRTLSFSGYGNPSSTGVYPYATYFNQVPYQPALTLFFPFAGPPMNYPGGPLCSDTVLCTFASSGANAASSLFFPSSSIYAHDAYTVDLTSGSITLISGTLPSTVPEPSSLVFVASGLIGLAGVGGRRLMRAAKRG